MLYMEEAIMVANVRNYFSALNSKNLNWLTQLYHEEVSLIEWMDIFEGKDAVLGANKRMLDGPDFNIDVKKYGAGNHCVLCEIEVSLKENGGVLTLKVVDVIEFRDEKIYKITAYRGW